MAVLYKADVDKPANRSDIPSPGEKDGDGVRVDLSVRAHGPKRPDKTLELLSSWLYHDSLMIDKRVIV